MSPIKGRDHFSNHRLLAVACHAGRLLVLVALMCLLPSPHRAASLDGLAAPELATLQAIVPAIKSVATEPDERGLFMLSDVSGQSIGYAGRTLPAAKKSVGYRGPTEAWFIMTPDETSGRLIVSHLGILQSHDTQEHVDAVANEPEFFQQFVGLPWGGNPIEDSVRKIDGVTGATLTSLAFAEGVLKRLGDSANSVSLKFPEPLQPDEIERLFPDMAQTGDQEIVSVRDAEGKQLGYLTRSGAWSDDIIGYQGPTECLIGFDADGRSLKPRIRSSFDNEPYVGYVPQEYSFWPAFTGRTIDELATLDFEAESIEGVSGATMTSMAVAETIRQTALAIREAGGLKKLSVPPEPPTRLRTLQAAWQDFALGLRLSAKEMLTLAIVGLLGVFKWAGWFRRPHARTLWLLVMFVGLGLWTGNLLSLALFAGWVTGGMNPRIALGLIVLFAVSLLAPPLKRANPYCNHWCPHGAAQQLLRPGNRSTRRRKLPAQLNRWLRSLPASLLALAYLLLLFRPASDVSSLEPFHGYLWSVATWASITFAIATLTISAFLPMGYCRYGCPTGRLLDYLRFNASAARLTRFDGGLLLLLVIAVAVRIA